TNRRILRVTVPWRQITIIFIAADVIIWCGAPYREGYMKRIFPQFRLSGPAHARQTRARLTVEALEARCLLNSNVLVNDPKMAGPGPRDTQSEATVLVALDGTVVVAFNDSNTADQEQFTGYAVSFDGGASFTDMGSLPANPNGDAGDPILARDDVT